MTQHSAHRATEQQYQLAEGPVWDQAHERVLWVDIPAGAVHVGDLQGDAVVPTNTYQVDATVGAVAVAEQGGLVVAGHQTVVLFDEVTHQSTELARIIPEGEARRLNDGKCDPAGRFLVGTLALGPKVRESLHQIDGERTVLIDDGLEMSNGLAWSPDGSTLYSVDTTPGILWQRPYEPESGEWGQRTELLRITDGSPDGICVDADGNLWVAVWGPGEVRQFDPSGIQIATITVPAPYTSCVTFVGPNLDRLLISTAIDDLSPRQIATYPDSGSLFLADVGARGLASTAWRTPPSLIPHH